MLAVVDWFKQWGPSKSTQTDSQTRRSHQIVTVNHHSKQINTFCCGTRYGVCFNTIDYWRREKDINIQMNTLQHELIVLSDCFLVGGITPHDEGNSNHPSQWIRKLASDFCCLFTIISNIEAKYKFVGQVKERWNSREINSNLETNLKTLQWFLPRTCCSLNGVIAKLFSWHLSNGLNRSRFSLSAVTTQRSLFRNLISFAMNRSPRWRFDEVARRRSFSVLPNVRHCLNASSSNKAFLI